MHCHKSRENGIPIQGPPSASAPAKKTEPRLGLGLGKQFVPVTYQVRQQEARMSSSPASRVLLSPMASPATPPSHSYPSPVPEPDTTYRLPSVQTLLPVSSTGGGGGPGHHNTDYGTLPADLFEPDSSERPGPASPLIMLTSVPHGWTRKIEIGKCQ